MSGQMKIVKFMLVCEFVKFNKCPLQNDFFSVSTVFCINRPNWFLGQNNLS